MKIDLINKSIKDMAIKNDISISEGYRKVVKKYWYKGSSEEEKCFIRYICETGIIIKNALDMDQMKVIQKSIC